MFAIVLGAFLLAADPSYRFADIPWGTRGEEVVERLKAAGFEDVKLGDQGHYRFAARLHDAPAIGYAIMADDRLVKVSILMMPAQSAGRVTYVKAKKALGEQYGAPASVTESLTPQGMFRAVWQSAGGETVLLQMNPRQQVEMHYAPGAKTEE